MIKILNREISRQQTIDTLLMYDEMLNDTINNKQYRAVLQSMDNATLQLYVNALTAESDTMLLQCALHEAAETE